MSIKSTGTKKPKKVDNPIPIPKPKVVEKVKSIDVESNLERLKNIFYAFATFFVGSYEEMSAKILFRRIIASVLDLIVLLAIIRYIGVQHTIAITLIYFVMLEGLIGIGSVGKWFTRLKVVVEDMYLDGVVKYSLTRLIIRALIKAGCMLYIVMQVYEVHFSFLDDNLIWFPFTALGLAIALMIPARLSLAGRTIHDAVSGTYVNIIGNPVRLEEDSPNRLFAMFEKETEETIYQEKIVIGKDDKEYLNKPVKPVKQNKQSSKQSSKKDDLDDLY